MATGEEKDVEGRRGRQDDMMRGQARLQGGGREKEVGGGGGGGAPWGWRRGGTRGGGRARV